MIDTQVQFKTDKKLTTVNDI